MKVTHLFVMLSLVTVILTLAGFGEIPEQINYQAKVEADGVPFDGAGQFKFAIVDSAGSNTFWSNDGSSVDGSEPTSAVALNVNGGLLNVMLGNESYPNMSAVPASTFAGPDTWLRMWFGGSAGTTFEKLSPDSHLASVPYAMLAETVPDKSITGEKLCKESVWPQHVGRNDCIVSYYVEYTGYQIVNLGVVSSNSNFIITDVSYGLVYQMLVNSGGYDEFTGDRNCDLIISYEFGGVETVLLKKLSFNDADSKYVTDFQFKAGLVIPSGAELKIGGFVHWPFDPSYVLATYDYPKGCTISGFTVPVE